MIGFHTVRCPNRRDTKNSNFLEISIAVLTCFSLLAFLMIIFGLLNSPFCAVQPMIPIWLIVEGVLFIISATLRIYFLIPTPKKTRYRRQQRKMGGSLLCKGIEALFALANLVWLILGEKDQIKNKL